MNDGAMEADGDCRLEERSWTQASIRSLAKYWDTPEEDAAWAYLQEESPAQCEAEERLLLAVKLYELGKITTGTAAKLAGIGREAFMFALDRFGLSPIGVEPDELAEDMGNA
jgi:predicted HTH domain antitoxin